MYSDSRRPLANCFFLLLVLAGCSGGSGSTPPPDETAALPSEAPPVATAVSNPNSAPVARIGGQYDTQVLRPGDTVMLDGSTSYDPDGDPLAYQWALVAMPVDSTASLLDSAAKTTGFVADVAGDYTVELTVSDHVLYSEPAYVTVLVAAHEPTKLNWGMHYDYGDGEDPDIAINNNGTVVQVFEDPDEFSTDLHYRVGITYGGMIDWGSRHHFGNGLFPSVDINDAGIVVEIDGNWDLTYRVGIVDRATKTIDFGSAHNDFESGRHASIAINNNNQVIEVHRSRACDVATHLVGGCQLLYRVGTVNAASRSVGFGSEHDNLPTGRRPSVDLNDQNDVIIVHEDWSQTDNSLYFQTATLNPGARSISRRKNGEYDKGAYPDIAINNARRLVETHKSQSKDTLWSALGYLRDNGSASIYGARPYSVGIATSVGMNDLDTFIASNDTRIDNLFYHFSRDFPAQKNTDRWMELTTTMHRKALRNVTLPGTHDSGAYELFTTLDGDPYNARGPDFFGLPVIDTIGTICDLPIPLLYKLWWACKIWVPTPVEFNENAQDIATAQSRSIGRQLNDGIRVFDIRITERNGHFYLYHGLLGNRLEIMLADVREFLERTNSELVFLEFSHLSTGQSTDDSTEFTSDQHHALMNAIVASLGDYMLASSDSSRDELFDMQLRELTADGSKVVVSYSWDEAPADTPNAGYFWGFGPDREGFYTVGNKVTARLDIRNPIVREDFDNWMTGSRTRLFKLIQTLTASKDVSDLEKFQEAVEAEDEIITSQVFFRRIVFMDYWPTLHKLSQDANHHLSAFLAEGEPGMPNVIMVDFYEESDAVAHAIEMSARCDEQAITGSPGVSMPTTWPPNHTMAPIEIDLGGLQSYNPDSLGGEITGVEIREPDRKTGEDVYAPNNFEPDYTIDGPLAVSLRSERSGQAADRHYVIKLLVWDCSGDYEFEATVTVPHDQGG